MKALVLISIFFLILFVQSSGALNVNSTATGTGTYNISGDRYSVEILGTNGQEQNVIIYGTKFNVCISCGFFREINLYNSTGGNVTNDLFSTSYFPNLMVVESGPSRVVLHGENTGSINAGFPSGTEVVAFNFSVDIYLYPNFYYNVYRVWGNFTKIKPNEFAQFNLLKFIPNTSFMYTGTGNLLGQLSSSSDIPTTDVTNDKIDQYFVFLWNGTQTQTFGHFGTANPFTTGGSLYWDVTHGTSANRVATAFDTDNNAYSGAFSGKDFTWGWVTWFGNNGGGNLSAAQKVNDLDFKQQFLQYLNPATIVPSAGSFDGRFNLAGTYNLTANSSQVVDFNFTTGVFNYTFPAFLIKNIPNAASVLNHVFWINYTNSSSFVKLVNNVDFIVQDGNSTFYGFSYIILLLNKSFGNGNSQNYRFWVSNYLDPAQPSIPPTGPPVLTWYEVPSLIEINRTVSKISCFKLANTGNSSASSISISATGISSSWYNLDTSYFPSSNPNTNQTVCVNFIVPSSAIPSDYSFTLNASNQVSTTSSFILRVSNVTPITAGDANQSIVMAQSKISEALRAGKNVTYAQQLYDQAVNYFNNQDYADAKIYADQAYSAAQDALNTSGSPPTITFNYFYLVPVVIVVFVIFVIILYWESGGSKDKFDELKEKWTESVRKNLDSRDNS